MNGERRRLCFVVQRYGRDVLGGAEQLCREVALRLARRYRITVVTTCARDYLTWENHYPPGAARDGEVELLRFPTRRPRRVRSFGRLSQRLYRKPHPFSLEAEWMERQGPDAPGAWDYPGAHEGEHDLFVFFTYLYATTFFGLPRVAHKALLVPMAHPEEPLRLGLFRYLFGLPRGFIFNTPEERELVQGTFRAGRIPSTVAGMGIDLPPLPAAPPPHPQPYLLYLGRLDVQKGVGELLAFFGRYREARPGCGLSLLLAGERKMRIPSQPGVRLLGYLPEGQKAGVLGGALALAAPSPHESLSITALEAWAAARPVLANGRSEVLLGQCRRSGGGLSYGDYAAFESALDRLLGEPGLAEGLGGKGRAYVAAEYAWENVERKYADFIDAVLAGGGVPK